MTSSAQEPERSSWFALPLIALVRLYHKALSPLLPATCRFYPSCSTYGLTALRRFGLIKGSWLTIRRLARCHPWDPGGVDHVPAKGTRGSACTDTAHIIAKDD